MIRQTIPEAVFNVKVMLHRAKRYLQWLFWRRELAKPGAPKSRPAAALRAELEVFAHESRLYKKLGDVDPELQQNKAASIEKALEKLNQLVLAPGEVFSFWYVLGKASRRRGFPEGLELRNGRYIRRPGGGLCQLTNMLHWMALNLDLEILERHRHSLDLFPDDQRSVPFGSGATVFYNYRDLRFRNSSGQTLSWSFQIAEEKLILRVFAAQALAYDSFIREEDHHFYENAGKRFRHNRLVLVRREKDSQETTTRTVLENDCEVCY